MRTTSLRCFVVGVLLALAGCDLALTAKPTARHAGLAPLPEHRGLAARYPADTGISADPAVVVADDFEAAPPGALPDRAIGERADPPDSPWDRVWGRPTVTENRELVHAGNRTLELARNGPGAVGVRKALDPGFDRLFLRYYIKYDDAFPGAHHVGGALQARAPGVPEANPGVKPDGANQYDVLLDHWPFDRRVPPPGHLVAYVYHMDQRHKWGEQFYPSGRTQPATNGASGFFGRSFVRRKDFVPARGTWQCHELMVQANTPGQRDGRVAFWVDGRLAADFPNIRFRTVDALKINRVGVGMYESRKNRRQRVWIDDIVVATTYVGPMETAR